MGQPGIRPSVPGHLESMVWAEGRNRTKFVFGRNKTVLVTLPGTGIRTIGVMGCGRGVGTSHLAVALANYLTGVKRKKTALLEWNSHGDFQILERFAGKNGRRQGEGQKKTERSRNKSDRFRIMEVDYYKMADPSVLSHCLSRDYHYIIMDYGEATEESLYECARCDRKILVGSLSEWKVEAFLEILEKTERRDKSWRMAVVAGGEDTRKEIESMFRCRLQRIPASVDAFRITQEEITCFETLLFAK